MSIDNHEAAVRFVKAARGIVGDFTTIDSKHWFTLDNVLEIADEYKIHAFFNAYFSKEDLLIIESNLIDALSLLIVRYTNYTKKVEHIFDNKTIVRNTLELIQDTLDTNFSLDELAKNSGLSKFHFLRVFKKELGITPHSFIINERLNKAEKLIRNGTPIAEASLLVGFNDQSHFTRNFKRYYGYTPSTLKRNSNIIL